MATAAQGAAGTIYDIGYQHYDGPRLGRPYAIRSLLLHGIGVVFGVGRGPRARLVPIVLTIIAILPAVIQAAVTAYAGEAVQLVGYADYFVQLSVIYVLFCAAQAPELVSADQRSRSLVLYLARALRRDDYVLAKLFALAVGVFALALGAQLVLFTGRVLGSLNAWEALRYEAPQLAPIFGVSALVSLVLASLSVAIASLTPRRALATAGIVGFFILSSAMAGILREAIEGAWDRWLTLLNPFIAVGGVSNWIFEAEPGPNSPLARLDLPGWAYAGACLTYMALAMGILWVRYRRIDA
ncbi:MAG: ABC transporter permease subunit [Gemmatimonadota bacterium]